MQKEKNNSPTVREIRVLGIVGCFLLFFGILLLIAVTTEETVSGRVTNLVSALIILAVGGGMFYRGVARHRERWLMPVVLFAVLAAVAAVAAFCITRLVPQEEEAVAEAEETQEEEPQQLEQEGKRSFLVEGLRQVGSAMKNIVKGISLGGLKIATAIGFALIAAVVWLVRRETVFEGVADRKWWRDLRIWTAIIMATQVIIYLLLGT